MLLVSIVLQDSMKDLPYCLILQSTLEEREVKHLFATKNFFLSVILAKLVKNTLIKKKKNNNNLHLTIIWEFPSIYNFEQSPTYLL